MNVQGLRGLLNRIRSLTTSDKIVRHGRTVPQRQQGWTFVPCVSRALLFLASLVALVALAFLARLSWQVYGPAGWRDEVYALVGLHGTRQALTVSLSQLWIESGRPNLEYTVGLPGELWPLLPAAKTVQPKMTRAEIRYSTEQFIEFYNRKMQYMHSHPDRFPRDEQKVQPDGAANGSQSSRREKNPTSKAAGSRR